MAGSRPNWGCRPLWSHSHRSGTPNAPPSPCPPSCRSRAGCSCRGGQPAMRVHPEPATGHPHVHWTPRGGSRHRRVAVALFLGGGSSSPSASSARTSATCSTKRRAGRSTSPNATFLAARRRHPGRRRIKQRRRPKRGGPFSGAKRRSPSAPPLRARPRRCGPSRGRRSRRGPPVRRLRSRADGGRGAGSPAPWPPSPRCSA